MPPTAGLAERLATGFKANVAPQPLIDVVRQHDRFRPNDVHDGLVSVYTMWNVLDRLNAKALHNYTLPWVYGYIRPVQLEALVAAVRSPGVRTYCEIGFNGGHSAAAVLYSTPNVTVRSFDLGAYGKHTAQNSEFLRTVQPDRFTFIDGDSAKTVPELGHRVRAGLEPSCDVLFIDGSHKLGAVAADIRNFRAAATCGAPVFMDDLDGEPGLALKQAVANGHFHVHHWVGYRASTSTPRTCMWHDVVCMWHVVCTVYRVLHRHRHARLARSRSCPCPQVLYDSRPQWEIPRGATPDGNVTLYVPDSKRVFNPCLRFYWHTRAVGLECHLQWDPDKCKACNAMFQWGLGTYSSCAHGHGNASDT